MENSKVFAMKLSKVYPLLVQKAQRKGRTQEEVDQVMALYNAITTTYNYDQRIYDIIKDMAGAYFAGDRGLDDTATQIQSRVKLYMNEQL